MKIETNAFEIAWGREIVSYYRFAKQSFIAVSKRMGHRTLKDTIALLEFDIMEDIDLKINFYDSSFYRPQKGELKNEIDINELKSMLSGVKYQLNGTKYNTKRFPYPTLERL